MNDIVRTETNETLYRGTIEGDRLRKILLDAVCDLVGLSRYTSYGLSLKILPQDGEPVCVSTIPDVRFELVQDHNWFKKETV